MKIFLISNAYPSDSDKVYGIFVKNTKEALKHESLNFIAQSCIYGKSKNKLHKGLKYIKLYFSFLYNVIFKKFDIAYIHFFASYSIPMILLLKIFRKKIVVNIHGADIVMAGYILSKFQNKLIKYIDLAIVPSIYFSNILQEKIPAIDKNNIYIYPSGGINTEVFCLKNKYELRKKYSIKNTFTIGYVSHINDNKGWLEFLNATYRFKNNIVENINIIMVGSGENEDKFEKELDRLSLQNYVIRFKQLEQPILSEIYGIMDIFIFPTKHRNESLGLSGLEAMACGVPVIGSNIAAIPTYLTDGKEGYLVKVGDSNDIYESILKYYNLSDTEKQKIKEHALNKALQYETRKVVLELKNMFFNIYKKEEEKHEDVH